jgi:hypothetical protein
LDGRKQVISFGNQQQLTERVLATHHSWQSLPVAFPVAHLYQITETRAFCNYRDCEALWELAPDVSWAVAKASTQLEHLSTSFMVDASYFLDARKPSWAWPNSTAFILTLQLLTPDGTPTEIDNLLQAAAGAIPEMPVD